MPSTRKRDVKDAATKGTLNPPHAEQKTAAQQRKVEERAKERQVGQFGDAGAPPMQKK